MAQVILDKALIDALDAAGYVIVPKEPTAEMCKAGMPAIRADRKRLGITDDTIGYSHMRDCWEDMINAALANTPLTDSPRK